MTMTTEKWRELIAGLLILNGLAHLAGFIWSGDSPLLVNLFGTTAAVNIVGDLLLAGAAGGFVGAGLGMVRALVPHAWWKHLAVAGIALSLLAIALFWNVIPVQAKLGSGSVDVVFLLAFAWANWPTTKLAGSY